MGREIYVGPYLKIDKRSQTETVNETINCCMNDMCPKHKQKSKENFCPECGNEISENQFIKERNISMHKIMEEVGIVDFLFEPDNSEFDGQTLLISNLHKYRLKMPFDEVYAIGFDEINHMEMMHRFNFSPPMVEFYKYLDKNDIEYHMHFGIVNYWY